ncbi:hypothetical protein ACS0TY_012585 [Phlomoides rotata]
MNSWLEHPQFKEFFQEKWKEYNIKGWAAYRLKEKLKLLKKDLREWNKVVFGNIDYNIDTKKKEIEVLDRIDDVMGLEEEEEIIQRNKNTAELIRFGQWKEKLLAQKAKARWLRDGDFNSSYFHGRINRNKKFNMIEGLLTNGVLFARSSRLIPDKANLGFRFPCDGPGRGGTCQVSAWDHVFLGLFWMYNSISVSDVWGSISDQGVVTHIKGGNFAQSSITINGWLRDFLWAQASQWTWLLARTY